jgi:hypothetical protein
MGANWCNTMQLYESLPETATLAHAGSPWHIFAVEAAPLIQPYVERCVAALAAGQPLPVPPVPPAGSSMQLLNYANDLGCSAEKVGRGRRARGGAAARADGRRRRAAGRERERHRVHGQRGQRNGRGGIATFGLQQVVHAGGLGHFGDQVLREEQVVLVGDDEHIVSAAGLATGYGLLQRCAAAQLHEGLGISLTRCGPKARAGTAGQDD